MFVLFARFAPRPDPLTDVARIDASTTLCSTFVQNPFGRQPRDRKLSHIKHGFYTEYVHYLVMKCMFYLFLLLLTVEPSHCEASG